MNNKELLLQIYFLRHQESVQNREGYGPVDTELTPSGQEGLDELSTLIKHIGVDTIHHLRTGTKKRHIQSAQGIAKRAGYNGEIIRDDRLNAIFSGPLLENPPEQTTKTHQLERFKPNQGNLHVTDSPEGGQFSFDPVVTGIHQFDPLYCMAYYDKALRNLVFPCNDTLTTFNELEKRVSGLQKDLIQIARDSPQPVTIVAVSSCSPSGFNLEYAAFGTTGEFMHIKFEDSPIFPQQHDEVMILGYSRKDQAEQRKRLSPIKGNTKIRQYLKP